MTADRLGTETTGARPSDESVPDSRPPADDAAGRRTAAGTPARPPAAASGGGRRQGSRPLFLARAGYRRRRLTDAARLLPWLGGVLFLAPVIWAPTAGTAAGVLYLFAVWALLIILSWAIARRLVLPPGEVPHDPPPVVGRDTGTGATPAVPAEGRR